MDKLHVVLQQKAYGYLVNQTRTTGAGRCCCNCLQLRGTFDQTGQGN